MALEIKPVLPTRRETRSEPASAPISEAPGPKPQSAPKRRRHPAARSTAVTSAAEPAPSPRALAGAEVPYAGERRVQASIHIYPSAWQTLEERARELAEAGGRGSASLLLVALLHFHIPADPETAGEIVQRFRQRLAGAGGEEAFAGEDAAERNVRLFASQRDRLDQLGRAVTAALQLRYGRMLLLNALLDEHAPATAADAERLLHAFELARVGVPDEAERIVFDQAA